jgi:phosphate transport system permease protein
MPLASLALGASETQTTFRIILPNSLPGIFTSALLGIGRVIGESAALVYTSGTAIQDVIIPTEGSATLAVHIWALMAGENPNITACCAVSIVILFVILLLSLLVKLLSFRISRQRKAQ